MKFLADIIDILLYTGRIDPNFFDDNETVIDDVIKKYPHAKSMEMETFVLFHLSNCCRIPIKASSAAIVVVIILLVFIQLYFFSL